MFKINASVAAAAVLSLGVMGVAMAGNIVDCSNAQNKNKSECARAKVNVNHRNDVVHCSNVGSGNKDECVRAKHDHNN